MKDKYIKASVDYMQAKGYEIIDTDYENCYGRFDIIAMDEKSNALVLVEVVGVDNIDNGFPEEKVSEVKRKELEMAAAVFLRDNGEDYSGRYVRFDKIDLLKIDNDIWMVKYHRNFLGAA